MTFTSIPPSLRPVVEDVAKELARREGEETASLYEWQIAEAAILAFLNACVERGVARTDATVLSVAPTKYGKLFVLNLGATDDTLANSEG